jgi:hypothetical protein
VYPKVEEIVFADAIAFVDLIENESDLNAVRDEVLEYILTIEC